MIYVQRYKERCGFICASCDRKRIEEKTKQFAEENQEREEFLSDDGIVCPYCGTVHQPGESGAFYNEGSHEFHCDDCRRMFIVETYISISYTSSKGNINNDN